MLLPPFRLFINKEEADESLQIRTGALRLKLHANKWIRSPSRQTLIVFYRGRNAICIVSAPAHQKEVGRVRWLTATETALFPIEQNQIWALLVHFLFLHLHLFDKAASSDGKWADKLRRKTVTRARSWRRGRQLINKWHHLPPRRLSACHIGVGGGKDKKEEEGGGGEEMSISPIRSVWMNAAVTDSGDSLSLVCGHGNFQQDWQQTLFSDWTVGKDRIINELYWIKTWK